MLYWALGAVCNFKIASRLCLYKANWNLLSGEIVWIQGKIWSTFEEDKSYKSQISVVLYICSSFFPPQRCMHFLFCSRLYYPESFAWPFVQKIKFASTVFNFVNFCWHVFTETCSHLLMVMKRMVMAWLQAHTHNYKDFDIVYGLFWNTRDKNGWSWYCPPFMDLFGVPQMLQDSH